MGHFDNTWLSVKVFFHTPTLSGKLEQQARFLDSIQTLAVKWHLLLDNHIQTRFKPELLIWHNGQIGSIAKPSWWKHWCIDGWWSERSQVNAMSSCQFKIYFRSHGVLQCSDTCLGIRSWTGRMLQIFLLITCQALKKYILLILSCLLIFDEIDHH